VIGAFYPIFSNEQYLFKNDTCPIYERVSIDKHKNILNFRYYIQPTNNTVLVQRAKAFLKRTPGVGNTLQNIPGIGMVNLTSTIVWTDYNNAVLDFSCVQDPTDPSNLFYYYVIAAKKRSFNDLNLLDFMFDIVQAVTANQTNTVVSLLQDKLCANQPANVF
jgi:hypothetical protein